MERQGWEACIDRCVTCLPEDAKHALWEQGVLCTVRATKGEDERSACGQLATAAKTGANDGREDGREDGSVAAQQQQSGGI